MIKYNDKDWNAFSEIISDTFKINGLWHYFSIAEAFIEISYPLKTDRFKTIDSLTIIDTFLVNKLVVKRSFNSFEDTVQMELIKSDAGKRFIICKMNKFTPKYITKSNFKVCTYDIDYPTFNKKKMFYIFPSDVKFKNKLQGQIYSDSNLIAYVDEGNKWMTLAKKSIDKKMKFNQILDYYLHLTNINQTVFYFDTTARNSILSVKFNKDSVSNFNKLKSEIFRIYSHEYVEANLDLNCGINALNNRWFADGLSEFYAYKLCQKYDQNTFQGSFLGSKKSQYVSRHKEYNQFKQHDNLLDWAMSKDLETRNTLRGEKHTYDNHSGQYARSLYFFIDIINEHGYKPLNKLFKHFEGRKNVTQTELLKVLSKLYNEDIEKRLSNY